MLSCRFSEVGNSFGSVKRVVLLSVFFWHNRTSPISMKLVFIQTKDPAVQMWRLIVRFLSEVPRINTSPK
jgi:hypothetical protein